MLPLRREKRTRHIGVCVHKPTHTHSYTHTRRQTHTRTHTNVHTDTTLTYEHTHAVSEKGKGFVTVTLQCEKWGVSLSEGRFVDTWEVRRRAEKKSPFKKVRVLVREFLSLSIIYQCLSLWQLLCQALPVCTEFQVSDPSCGSHPSSGLTSLVHQWLVIRGGGTAGPEASRTAKCFFFFISVQKQNSV